MPILCFESMVCRDLLGSFGVVRDGLEDYAGRGIVALYEQRFMVGALAQYISYAGTAILQRADGTVSDWQVRHVWHPGM